MEYKIKSQDPAVSLHDCVVNRIIFGEDIIFEFDDGIDIPKQNSQNHTNHHMHTGKAAVVLGNGIYKSGISYLEKDEKAKISAEELETTELEILSFEFDQNTGEIKISADADRSLYFELVFSAESVEYCWDEFTDTAWFDGAEEIRKAQNIYKNGKSLIDFNLKVFLGLVAVLVPVFAGYIVLGDIFGLICFLVVSFAFFSVFPALILATVGVSMLIDAQKRGYGDIKDYLFVGILEILYNLGWIGFYFVGFFSKLFVE